MIPDYRQGFDHGLLGLPDGDAVQSVYAKPDIDLQYQEVNSWAYPFGNPWGWKIYPWNWGKEGEADKEKPTPEGTPQGAIPESPTTNILLFAAIVAAAWFLIRVPGKGA